MNRREAAKTVAAMASDIVKNGGDASIVWKVAQKLNDDVLPAKLWMKTK
jgi:hypothetical protein